MSWSERFGDLTRRVPERCTVRGAVTWRCGRAARGLQMASSLPLFDGTAFENVWVLAGCIDVENIATVVATTMPAVSSALHVPRIVGVFHFGHPFDVSHISSTQRLVL